jgi:uncharacterized membrane protein YhaH (DUF805 family)
MKGNVIGFDPDTNTGAISGHDGQRYDFVTAEWHGDRRPRHGDVVDFVAAGQHATQIYLVEEAFVAPSIGQFLLSPSGRISRSQYWLKWALPVAAIVIVLILLVFAASDDPRLITFIIPIVELIVLWPSIAILIKRSHDRNRSGWFILLFLVPFLNFWPFIELLFMRGTIGSNRFGPDPVPAS